MKFQIISDIHLDFYFNNPKPIISPVADNLIIAGDMMTNSKPIREDCIGWWYDLSKKFKNIFIVLGNHDYYHGYFEESMDDLKKYYNDILGTPNNIKILDNMEPFRFENLNIMGCTFWTHPKPNETYLIQRYMNDYRRIVTHGERFIVKHTDDNNKKNRINLISNYDKSIPTIIITHHAPLYQSISDRYIHSDINSAYVNDMEYFLKDNHPIAWIHGHVHSSADYMCYKTRIIANSMGYPINSPNGLENINFNPELVLVV